MYEVAGRLGAPECCSVLSPQHSPPALPSALPLGPAMTPPPPGFFIPVPSLPLLFLMLEPANRHSPSKKSTPLLPPVHGVKLIMPTSSPDGGASPRASAAMLDSGYWCHTPCALA